MKIPKKIHLLDGEYKITQSKPKKINYKNGKGAVHRVNGTLYYESKLIDLKKTLSEGQKEKTLWHELGHHFFNFFNISNEESLAEAFSKYTISCLEQLGYKK